MHGRMDDRKSYATPVRLGDVMGSDIFYATCSMPAAESLPGSHAAWNLYLPVVISNKPTRTSNTISPFGRSSITAHWPLAVGSGGAEIGRGGGEKQRPYVGSALGSKGQLEFSLSLGPSPNRRLQSSRTDLGQPQDFAAAVVPVLLDGD